MLLRFPLTDRSAEERGYRELACWWECRDEIWNLENSLIIKYVFIYIVYVEALFQVVKCLDACMGCCMGTHMPYGEPEVCLLLISAC